MSSTRGPISPFLVTGCVITLLMLLGLILLAAILRGIGAPFGEDLYHFLKRLLKDQLDSTDDTAD